MLVRKIAPLGNHFKRPVLVMGRFFFGNFLTTQ